MAAVYLTAEEIVSALEAEGHETSKRTVDRQLAWIKANDADNYNRMVKHEGKKLLYKQPLILPYLKEFKQNKKLAAKPTAKADKVEQKKAQQPVEEQSTRKRSKQQRTATNSNYREPENVEAKLEDLLNAPHLLFEPDEVTRDTYSKLNGLDKLRYEYAISICAEYSLGLNNLEYCCTKYNIPVKTFWYWRTRIADIALLFKNARRKCNRARSELLQDAAESSLMKLVQGHEYIETTTIYQREATADGQFVEVVKEQRKTNKVVLPSLGAAIFTATNRAPKRWKNRQYIAKETAPEKPADGLQKYTEAELLAIAMQNLGLTPDQVLKAAEQ